MKATYEFCKAYPSKPEDPDAVSRRFAELDNFTVLSDQYHAAISQLAERNQQNLAVDELLTKKYLQDFNQKLRTLCEFVGKLMEAEPILAKQLPQYGSLFCRNRQGELCQALAKISQSFTAIEEYKEQVKLNRMVCVDRREEIRRTLEDAVMTVEENVRQLHDEAIQLGL